MKAASKEVTILINFPPSLTLTAPAFKMKKAALELILVFSGQLLVQFRDVKIVEKRKLTRTLHHIPAPKSR